MHDEDIGAASGAMRLTRVEAVFSHLDRWYIDELVQDAVEQIAMGWSHLIA